jgi:enoyl-CoA hydratase/carnithine racemase
MPSQQLIELTRSGSVAIATIDTPPMNTNSLELLARLAEIIEEVENDASVRVLVLTGSGNRAFSAGSDIKEMPDMLATGDIIERKINFEDATFTALENMSTPTIAALNGVALGGGLELALCCDFIVAVETTRVGLPEIKLGLMPGAGGAIRATRRVGEGRAKQLIYLGDLIDTPTALSWGLIDKLAPEGEALATALKLADVLCERPAQSLAHAKRAIALRRNMSDSDALEGSVELFGNVCATQDAAEGVSAFLEKREPRFSHR